MTRFMDNRFSVPLGSKQYRDNWDAVFGKKVIKCAVCNTEFPEDGEPHIGPYVCNKCLDSFLREKQDD